MTLGPALGPVPSPFAVAINRSSPRTASALGYQSVGIKPVAERCPFSSLPSRIPERSKTATALSEESATNRRLPSSDIARALGEVPEYCWPGRRVPRNLTGLPSAGDATATVSALDSATYSSFSSGLNSMAVGCDPGSVEFFGGSSGIQRVIFPLAKSSSATRDAFHKLHQARRPSRLATTVSGKDAGTSSFVLRPNVLTVRPVLT